MFNHYIVTYLYPLLFSVNLDNSELLVFCNQELIHDLLSNVKPEHQEVLLGRLC